MFRFVLLLSLLLLALLLFRLLLGSIDQFVQRCQHLAGILALEAVEQTTHVETKRVVDLDRIQKIINLNKKIRENQTEKTKVHVFKI